MVKIGYYGNFNISYSTETYIASALERAGHTVIRRNKNDINLVDCDYILFAKLSKPNIIVKARKEGIPSICWIFDLYRKYPRREFSQFKADIVITTDGDDEYYTIRQAIHKPEKKMILGEKIYDVIFVGMVRFHRGRKEMLDRIKPKIFGNVRGLALNKLLGQAKIALGDSYPASNYWSNRVYEMTGRGGFYIHPKTKGMSKYIPQFERGKEKEMIEYYLKHEDEREELRKIQFKNCPTYDDRIKELMKLLNDII